MGPVDLGARLDMAFQIVGMQLDQAGHHQIAAAVDGARRNGRTRLDCADHAVGKMKAAAKGLTGQNKQGIGKYGISHEESLTQSGRRWMTASCHRSVTLRA
jgi:hypothetical protein